MRSVSGGAYWEEISVQKTRDLIFGLRGCGGFIPGGGTL